MAVSPEALTAVQRAAQIADAAQASDLVALDVTGPLPLTDAFLLASGRNERHVSAIARDIEDELLVQAGLKPIRREGRAEGRWVLLDFGDLIVHVFHEDERQYYQLERLWKDCPAIPLELTHPTEDRADSDATLHD